MKIESVYRIALSQKIHKNIQNFIDAYKQIYLDMYSDTGIFYEELIKKNYLENAKRFKEEIYNAIENIFIQEKIFGVKKGETQIFSVTTSVGNYRLFLDFQENKSQKIRYVEDINIYKK